MELSQIIKNNLGRIGPGDTGSNPEDLNQIMDLKHVIQIKIYLIYI